MKYNQQFSFSAPPPLPGHCDPVVHKNPPTNPVDLLLLLVGSSWGGTVKTGKSAVRNPLYSLRMTSMAKGASSV